MSVRPGRSPRLAQRALLGAALAAIAWGALAFGAVYPWAFRPLAWWCGAVGLGALVVERRGRPAIGALSAALAAIAVAVAVQLAPLPTPALARISPGADAFLRQYDLAYALGRSVDAGVDGATAPRRPLSIAPEKTVTGLALFCAFALFVLGLSRVASSVGAMAVVGPIVYFGLALAVLGIGQDALNRGRPDMLVYGFWKPRYEGSTPFGPFINGNHFAGWTLMVLPLALAAFYDALERTLQSRPAHRSDRMAILNSPLLGSLLIFGFACLVMGLALVMTRSRSGVAALAVGSALAGWAVFRRQERWRTRVAVLGAFLLLLGGAGAWAGLDVLSAKFLQSDKGLTSVGGRLEVWQDTVAIIRQFPVTGTGLDTFGVATVFYQTAPRDLHFQEAHNDFLQLAAEGGLLVGVPVVCALGVFVRDIRRRFREAPKTGTTYWLRVGAVIGLVSIALQSLVEFSLQMPGNAALFAVLAAIALHRSPNLRSAPRAMEPELVRVVIEPMS